jgi:hypothetical protein
MVASVLKNKIRRAVGQVEDKLFLENIYTQINTHLAGSDLDLSEEVKTELDRWLKRTRVSSKEHVLRISK